MVSAFSILACILTLAVSLILPVVLLIILSVRNRRQGILPAWLLGAAGFFVPQVLIRLPILNSLAVMPGFMGFTQNHLFLYALSLAFTAGLFELAGRLATAKILNRKGLTWKRSLAAGLGHGGIEAILIVGMTYVNNLVIMVMINSGGFEALITQTAAMGGDVAQLQAVRTAILTTSPSLFLLAGFERLLTMIAQAAMSMVVCWGVHVKKAGKASLVCLLFHTLIDTSAGISMLATDAGGNVLSQTTAYTIVYVILILAAAASLYVLREIRRRWMAEGKEGTL